MTATKNITLHGHDIEHFANAVQIAFYHYQDMAQRAAPIAPAFGMDDDPAKAKPVDATQAAAYMLMLSSVERLKNAIRVPADGENADSDIRFTYRMDEDDDSKDTLTLHLSDHPAAPDTILIEGVCATNGRAKSGVSVLKVLQRIM